MKKIFLILLVLCFVLAGCNNQTNLTSSIELSSSDFSSTHSSSDVSKFESSSNIDVSSELAEGVIEKEGGTCGNIEFHASFESTDEFIQWAKIGGENTDGTLSKSKDNPCSAFFLDWRKNKTVMTIPKLKNKEYELRIIKVDDDCLLFRFFIKNEEIASKPSVINICAFPLNEQQDALSLGDLANALRPLKNYYYGNSNWGDFVAGTVGSYATHLGFVKSSMFFVVKPSIISKTSLNPWQEEYFDYFDFETVSLN